MKIIIVGFDGQLGLDCRKVLHNHQLLTPSLEELNLLNEKGVADYISAAAPDVIINCAAYTAVDNCEKERDLCWQINAHGPALLARASKLAGARLIHVSTDYVFDGNKAVPQPYIESDPVNPLSQYGASKLAGEQAVMEHLDDYTILRTAWLYSAHGPNFLKTMLRITLADPGAVRKVVNDQYGSLTWSYTLAKQISRLLDSSFTGIAHTTSNGYSTWYGAACYFLEKLGLQHNLIPCATEDYPTPARRPINSILDNAALQKAGLDVFADWKEDVDKIVQEFGEELLREQQAS